MNKNKCYKIFEKLKQHNPTPTTELKYKTPFELLIAAILSAQATDVSVNKVTNKLFPVANTPEALIKIGEKSLKDFIKSIGLFNMKAANIIKSCHILVEKYNSVVPQDRKYLESLPGVGRKTANVILNTVFNQPTIAVDTHVFRVSNRIGLAKGKNVLEVERGLLRIVPNEFKCDAHHLLILHGRYVCKARKPHCDKCVIADLCEGRQ